MTDEKFYTEAEAQAMVAAAFEAAKRECLRTTPLGSGMSLQADRDDCVERIGALIPAAAKAHLDAMLKEAGRFVHEEMEMARKDARCSLYTNEDNPSLDCPATRGDTCTCKVIARAALDAMLAKAREEGRDEGYAKGRLDGPSGDGVVKFIAPDYVQAMVANARAEGAAAEREACARESEAWKRTVEEYGKGDAAFIAEVTQEVEIGNSVATAIAARIRARGKETK